MSDKITPEGEPMTEQELDVIADISPQDIAQSIAKASPEIKPYLNAKTE